MMPLTRIERAWARAMFDTFFPPPPRGALPLGIADLDLDGFLDDTFGRVPFESAMGLRLTIWVVGLAPLFVLGRLATIAALSFDDRERVLGALLASRVYFVRGLVVGLKAIGSLLYCGDPRVRACIVAPAAVASAVASPAASSAGALVTLRAPAAKGTAAQTATDDGARKGEAHEHFA